VKRYSRRLTVASFRRAAAHGHNGGCWSSPLWQSRRRTLSQSAANTPTLRQQPEALADNPRALLDNSLSAAPGSSSPNSRNGRAARGGAGHVEAGPLRPARRRRPDQPLPCWKRFFFWGCQQQVVGKPPARGSVGSAQSWAASDVVAVPWRTPSAWDGQAPWGLLLTHFTVRGPNRPLPGLLAR
jgi:hypothetical protein